RSRRYSSACPTAICAIRQLSMLTSGSRAGGAWAWLSAGMFSSTAAQTSAGRPMRAMVASLQIRHDGDGASGGRGRGAVRRTIPPRFVPRGGSLGRPPGPGAILAPAPRRTVAQGRKREEKMQAEVPGSVRQVHPRADVAVRQPVVLDGVVHVEVGFG